MTVCMSNLRTTAFSNHSVVCVILFFGLTSNINEVVGPYLASFWVIALNTRCYLCLHVSSEFLCHLLLCLMSPFSISDDFFKHLFFESISVNIASTSSCWVSVSLSCAEEAAIESSQNPSHPSHVPPSPLQPTSPSMSSEFVPASFSVVQHLPWTY